MTTPRIGLEKLTEDIHRVVKQLGHQPSAEEYDKHGEYSFWAVRNTFKKGWREILVSLGYKIKKRPKDPFNYKEIVTDLQKVKQQLGRLPSFEEYEKLGKTGANVVKRVTKSKNWTEVLIKVFELDADTVKEQTKLNYKSTEEHLAKLKELAQKLGRTPTSEEANKYGFGVSLVKKRLNTDWAGVLKAAELSIKELPPKARHLLTTNEEIVRDLQRVAKLIGKCPTRTDYKKEGKYSIAFIDDRFGGWMKFLEAANLEPSSNKRLTRYKNMEEYLKDLVDLTNKLGYVPNYTEASRNGFHTSTLIKRLGVNWRGVLSAAGISLDKLRKTSQMRYVKDEEILLDINRVAKELGNYPSSVKYEKLGYYLPDSVVHRFNTTWQGVIELAKLCLEKQFLEQQKELNLLEEHVTENDRETTAFLSKNPEKSKMEQIITEYFTDDKASS